MLKRYHRIKVQVPIPREVSPAHVVSTLQTFEPLLDSHYYVVKYDPKPGPISDAALAVINGDPFLRQDPNNPSSGPVTATDDRWRLYDTFEDVYWVPFLLPYFSRLKRYLAIGCRTEGGVRFREGGSGGIVNRGAFTVVERETGRPHGYASRDTTRPVDDNWDGETKRGSIVEDEGSENRNRDRDGDGNYVDEKWMGDWGPQDDADTDTESEPAWDIVCECEIEMPFIWAVPALFRRSKAREFCEYLCKSVIEDTIGEFDEYWDNRSRLISEVYL
ncbi:hypothetical protein GGR51DRAFT_298732 [Nemania sp. FL0031]|nr:hypothetical protein GGR51DRAFT_298732 [Nemania sp. FL0031]